MVGKMKANYEDAMFVLRRLKSLGHDAYLAGGCVRDMQLGLQPNDYDVTTSATPEEIQAAFEKTVPVGVSFGVVKVICGDIRELDVATFRRDGVYSDNRRPDSVEYSSSAEEDVQRRDFTINALLMDVNGKVIDYVGGIGDLKNRMLRTVGNAGDRFSEDALRMLRAIRFAVRFRMDVDSQAWLTIRAMANTIKNVSNERVTDEFSKMFCYNNADRAYFLLRTSGLWKHIFDQTPDADDSWRTMFALAHIQPEDPFVLTLAILITEMWSQERDRVTSKLVLTNSQKRDLESLLGRIEGMRHFMYKSLAEQRKIMQWENKDLVTKFLDYEADGGKYNYDFPYSQNEAFFYVKMAEVNAMGWPGPLITGDDLISMGFIPGPVFTGMLELVRDQQLEGNLTQIEAVKPFLISRFPATARKLDDGTIFDDTVFRRIIAQCPQCSLPMSCEVPKSPEGKYLWDQIRDRINMRSWETHAFTTSACCTAKKAKSAFREMKA